MKLRIPELYNPAVSKAFDSRTKENGTLRAFICLLDIKSWKPNVVLESLLNCVGGNLVYAYV